MIKLILGTRGSALALWQAQYVKNGLENLNPGLKIVIKKIKTKGDRDQKSSLTQIGGIGVFTKTIENELVNGNIDIAVHSLKDLPSHMSSDLMLGAVPKRGSVEDVFIGREADQLELLPPKSVIATGSIRRISQIMEMYPDINCTDLRGNINTRLEKLIKYKFDGIIMAKVAIERLNLNKIRYQTLPVSSMLPAVGQGAIAVQVRKNDYATRKIVQSINDEHSNISISGERAFLARLDSGCQFPVGANAVVKNENLLIRGFVGSENGENNLRHSVEVPITKSIEGGILLAEDMIKMGARKLLDLRQ